MFPYLETSCTENSDSLLGRNRWNLPRWPRHCGIGYKGKKQCVILINLYWSDLPVGYKGMSLPPIRRKKSIQMRISVLKCLIWTSFHCMGGRSSDISRLLSHHLLSCHPKLFLVFLKHGLRRGEGAPAMESLGGGRAATGNSVYWRGVKACMQQDNELLSSTVTKRNWAIAFLDH